MALRRRRLSLSQARRLALGAQGFARGRPTGKVTQAHLQRAMGEMGVIQIDSVNVIARSQDLVLFSRLGDHSDDLIPRATAQGRMFEYWVHEASHVPSADHHLYRWRMREPPSWSGLARFAEERPGLLDEVEAMVAQDGPLVASDLGMRDQPKDEWWSWDVGKSALEVLFRQGRVAATRRRSDFARVYDLPSRVLPAEVLTAPTPPGAEARKQLIRNAAASLGVATIADLADYHRQKRRPLVPLIDSLVDAGELVEVEVEGWRDPAYLLPDAVIPRNIGAAALLSPFDPVVWNRPRNERLFDFHYRIEIYTPKAKRRYGYYVLPFLLGERIVGRVDLKADRQNGVLIAHSAWLEDHADPVEVDAALRVELDMMAGWLGLGRVERRGAGDLW